tara:strand:- start:372 stop:722 length:351 start_codon:yes stop_codon:yes gene_type:complete
MTANYGSTLSTTHTDQATDDPSQARADINSLINEVNLLLADRGANSGFCDLDSTGKVPAARLTDTVGETELKSVAVTNEKVAPAAITFDKFKATITTSTTTPTGGSVGDMHFVYIA